jgi:hypothetical protein
MNLPFPNAMPAYKLQLSKKENQNNVKLISAYFNSSDCSDFRKDYRVQKVRLPVFVV